MSSINNRNLSEQIYVNTLLSDSGTLKSINALNSMTISQDCILKSGIIHNANDELIFQHNINTIDKCNTFILGVNNMLSSSIATPENGYSVTILGNNNTLNFDFDIEQTEYETLQPGIFIAGNNNKLDSSLQNFSGIILGHNLEITSENCDQNTTNVYIGGKLNPDEEIPQLPSNSINIVGGATMFLPICFDVPFKNGHGVPQTYYMPLTIQN